MSPSTLEGLIHMYNKQMDMEKKKCKQCQTEKSVNEFSKDRKNKYREYQNNCKECQSYNAREYYKKNKDKKKAQTVIWNEAARDRNYKFLFRWMSRYAKCVDCGFDDIRALEFDHVRGEKYKGVKDMCNRTAAISTIKEEIKKCEIRCANCHRIKTQKQFNQRTSRYKDYL